jgi:hypothetical protein
MFVVTIFSLLTWNSFSVFPSFSIWILSSPIWILYSLFGSPITPDGSPLICSSAPAPPIGPVCLADILLILLVCLLLGSPLTEALPFSWNSDNQCQEASLNICGPHPAGGLTFPCLAALLCESTSNLPQAIITSAGKVF